MVRFLARPIFARLTVVHARDDECAERFRALGVAPERCLVVEDSSTGTRAALAAGMRVIGFVGAGHIPAGHAEVLRELGAIAIVEHMRELPETVARLRRESRVALGTP